MVDLLLEGFSTRVAGAGAVPTTALLGQPLGLTLPVEVEVGTGEGTDPVDVDPDPFAPQAASNKGIAAASETSKKNDRRLLD